MNCEIVELRTSSFKFSKLNYELQLFLWGESYELTRHPIADNNNIILWIVAMLHSAYDVNSTHSRRWTAEQCIIKYTQRCKLRFGVRGRIRVWQCGCCYKSHGSHSFIFQYTFEVAMKLLLCQFVFSICTLYGNKSSFTSGCGFKEYFSEDIPGCVNCPVNCDDQYSPDIEKCKKACGKYRAETFQIVCVHKIFKLCSGLGHAWGKYLAHVLLARLLITCTLFLNHLLTIGRCGKSQRLLLTFRDYLGVADPGRRI